MTLPLVASPPAYRKGSADCCKGLVAVLMVALLKEWRFIPDQPCKDKFSRYPDHNTGVYRSPRSAMETTSSSPTTR